MEIPNLKSAAKKLQKASHAMNEAAHLSEAGKKIVSEVAPSKPWYLSKTIWSNLVLGVVVNAVPALKASLTPDMLSAIFMVANLLLRLVTKEKLKLK